MLGMTADDAEALRQVLLEVVQNPRSTVGQARPVWTTLYPRLLKWSGKIKEPTLRSGWIIEHGSEHPQVDDVLSSLVHRGDQQYE